MLGNHTNESFGLSRAFLRESQQLVRQLSYQISSFSMGTHQSSFNLWETNIHVTL